MIAHSRRWSGTRSRPSAWCRRGRPTPRRGRGCPCAPGAYTGRARSYMPLDPTGRGAVAEPMHFGVVMFPTDYAMRVDDLARAVEARGFESLWFPEHTHIPVSRRSPWPGGPTLPKEYWHTHDLVVALATAAAVTTTLKVGSGICLLVERDPITTAKEVASLDFLSRGRVLFGIGGGWNAEEMEDHGTDFKQRWRVLRERVLAMKRIWSEDEASFEGAFVRFEPLWSWPKPVQKPHPPILLGGHGPRALARVVDYCDGWLPISVRAGDLEAGMAELRRLASEKGRDPRSISVSVYGAPMDAAGLARFRDLGVARAIFALPSAEADALLPLLDRAAGLARQLASRRDGPPARGQARARHRLERGHRRRRRLGRIDRVKTLRLLESMRDVPRAAWDALVGDGSPFLEWEWLAVLEDSGAATAATGWLPRFLTLWEGERLVGACPLYVKGHSLGEFVFDQNWAGAAARARIAYYPKLLVAVPFTPVTGARFLAAPGADRGEVIATLAAAVEHMCDENDLSSAHVNFCLPDEAAALEARGWLARTGWQYHWTNPGFASFEDYLGSLRSKRRNQVRRERRELAAEGVEIVTHAADDIPDAPFPRMFPLYPRTVEQLPWGQQYLDERFFTLARERLRPRP